MTVTNSLPVPVYEEYITAVLEKFQSFVRELDSIEKNPAKDTEIKSTPIVPRGKIKREQLQEVSFLRKITNDSIIY